MAADKEESTGLKYLQRVRPRAMEHLLKFFSESARHLDPKTRFLISIVTKVISHSPRGVRQYVKRAMQEGASADEILDAVLCAYPCAGLTRVVDAVDVILKMGIPEFNAERLAAEAGGGDPPAAEAPKPAWLQAAALSEIPAGGGKLVQLGPRGIALFRTAVGVAAVDDLCPHRGGSLAGGVVINGEVVCPLHQWNFRLEDGRCLANPRASIRAYETRIEGGVVFVKV